MCALMHPNGGDLRDYAGMETPEKFMCEDTGNFKTVIADSLTDDAECGTEVSSVSTSVSFEDVPESASQTINKRFNYIYPYSDLTRIPQKVTASELAHANSDKPLERVLPMPDFLKEKKVTGAMRGTAMHTYLEHCDFNLARTDIGKDIERIKSLGYLSDDQVTMLDLSKLEGFVNSNVVSLALSAQEVLREYRFTVNIPAKMVDETISSPFADTPVVLQGAVDLLIVDKDGIIIVDYKTDRVKNSDDLLRMYSKQLNLYKEAVSQIFSKPVKSCLIYSVHLNEIKEVYV